VQFRVAEKRLLLPPVTQLYQQNTHTTSVTVPVQEMPASALKYDLELVSASELEYKCIYYCFAVLIAAGEAYSIAAVN